MMEYMFLVTPSIKIIPISELISGRIGRDPSISLYIRIIIILRQALMPVLKYLADGVGVRPRGHSLYLQGESMVPLQLIISYFQILTTLNFNPLS